MPRRFPIVQFPNRSLTIAMVAGLLAQLTGGRTQRGATILARLATLSWAAQEIGKGANWFRRLLGLAAGAHACRGLSRSLRG